MLAGNALIRDLRVVLVAGEITMNVDPRHLAADSHLMFTNNRNIVLTLTCHHSGVATHASAEVDDHAPLLAHDVHQFRGTD